MVDRQATPADPTQRGTPPPPRGRGAELLVIAVAILVAAIVRLLYLSELTRSPFFSVPLIDAQTYDELARRLAGGDWSGGDRPFWQPPFYSYFLALLYSSGAGPLAVRLVQMAIGALTVGLTARLGILAGGWRAGLLAGLAAAFYGPLLFFEGRLLPPVLILFFNLLGLNILLSARRLRTHAAAGLAFGLAVVARPDAVVIALGLAVGLLLSSRPRRRLATLVFLLALAVPVAPVTLRNVVVGHDLVWVSANGGINFYLGNNPRADETIAMRPGRQWEQLVSSPQREVGVTRASERSRYFYGQALDYMRQQPAAATGNLLRKAVRFINAEEIPRNEDMYQVRNESRLFSALLWRAGAFAFPLGIVGPLAMLGAVRAWRCRRRLWPLFVFGAGYAVVVVAYFVTSRYRLPVVPVACCLAALGIEQLLEARHDRHRLVRLAMLTLLLTVLINLNFASPRVDSEGDYWRLRAIAEHELGNHAAAIDAQERAITGQPRMADLHYDLGVYRLAVGDSLGGMAAYREALRLDPEYAEAMVNLGQLLASRDSAESSIHLLLTAAAIAPNLLPAQIAVAGAFLHHGHVDSALAHYDLAAQLNERSMAAWAGRGAALLVAGRPDDAISAYRRAIDVGGESLATLRGLGTALKNAGRHEEALATLRHALQSHTSPELLVTLGQVYRRLGRLEEARQEYRRALELDPYLVQAHVNLGDVYSRQGLYDQAKLALDTALRIEPRNTTALYNRAAVEELLGERAVAVMYLERLVEIDPDHQLGLRALERARRATAPR